MDNGGHGQRWTTVNGGQFKMVKNEPKIDNGQWRIMDNGEQWKMVNK